MQKGIGQSINQVNYNEDIISPEFEGKIGLKT